MRGFFMAGSELVYWELTATSRNGPFRLAIRHTRGVIVEYFNDATAAMCRQEQLERVFLDTAADSSVSAVQAGLTALGTC